MQFAFLLDAVVTTEVKIYKYAEILNGTQPQHCSLVIPKLLIFCGFSTPKSCYSILFRNFAI